MRGDVPVAVAGGVEVRVAVPPDAAPVGVSVAVDPPGEPSPTTRTSPGATVAGISTPLRSASLLLLATTWFVRPGTNPRNDTVNRTPLPLLATLGLSWVTTNSAVPAWLSA